MFTLTTSVQYYIEYSSLPCSSMLLQMARFPFCFKLNNIPLCIHLLLGKKALTNLDSILKKQRHYFADKGPSCQSYVFSSSHVWMWELDHKKSRVPKNWCFCTVVLEKTESPLDCKGIKPVDPKGNQSWIFIGRTDAEAPILWPPDAKNWLIGKDSDAGKDWGQKEKGTTEAEMVGWHHQLDGHEFEQAPGVLQSGKPGVLQSMGLQGVRPDWATELTHCVYIPHFLYEGKPLWTLVLAMFF